jgi:hypothetical protein
MTPQQHKEVARYLKAFDFSGLFTDPSIGWDWPDTGKPLSVPVPWRGKDVFHILENVADKKGVRVFHVPPLPNGEIMPSDERKKLEKAVTPLATEHLLIFTDAEKTRQIWLWTSRLPGKPVRHRELTWEKGRPNELLLQKLTSIAFTLDEEEALDITGVVQRLRDNLDRDRLTKRFYDDFRKHKDAFQKFITGISEEGIMAHYTSLMLNRLMFCYFLQQKGFLDGDQNYLRSRFETVRDTLGKNKFHSFYRSFLRRLFHDGLDSQSRPDELTTIIGKNIPYLNGGIFAEHPIERAHPDITIPDEAFGKIFDFFDEWNWHLDDRPLAAGNEINPEVLGYVFEKYTNQREMGAYYTKEDITEYISKNTILPFLLQKIAAKLPADSWDLLKSDPDRYIYEPVRRGAGADEKEWKDSLPKNIAKGLDTKAAELISRRKAWNTPTPHSHALPTEIWRDTIARHQHCHSLRNKLRAGEVRESADLVTFNLDIRQFAQDVISSAPGDLALAMWKALRSISVLDPTCGSGAFLFAALAILEPLYEGLLERLRALLADWRFSGEKHPNWEKEIKAILIAVDNHPNEAYYIHKTIIVHNLYGVDIMEEAVEICKLRLFLKLAAQLQPGQAVEPLPDIDFNVRSGNTLVGYASRDEIRRAFTAAQGGRGGEQMSLLGIENSLDDFRHIMEQAEDADRAFRRFQDLQDILGQSPSEFATAKHELERILASLRSQLDRFLAGQYDQKNLKSEAAFKKWRSAHEPFHWFVEFYGIMNGGGFDVIVGNPPYLEEREVQYKLLGYISQETKAIHAVCMERSSRLLLKNGLMSMIVPLSLPSTQRMQVVQELLESGRDAWFANYAWRPAKLFDTVNRALTLFVVMPSNVGRTFSTNYQKWTSDDRNGLMERLNYVEVLRKRPACWIPKVGNTLEQQILGKCLATKTTVKHFVTKSAHRVYYRTTGGLYWKVFTDFAPAFNLNGKKGHSSRETFFTLDKKEHVKPVIAALSSDIFWWWYTVTSNVRDLNPFDVQNFPIPISALSDSNIQDLGILYLKDLGKNSAMLVREQKQTGTTETQSFKIQKSKPLIDQIDTILAEHYGFTEEELDFIINYDIKYRMGLSGGSVEDDES